MARTIPDNEHLEFNDSSEWAPLFEIALADQTHYVTPNHEAIDADGNTYSPFPVYLEEISEDGGGEVQTVRLVVSGINNVLSTQIKQADGIDGHEVVYKVYSCRRAQVIREEHLEIIKCSGIKKDSISLELGAFNPFLVQMLQEKFLTDFCWNRYKGEGCWLKNYDGTYRQPDTFAEGSPDSCTQRINDCKRHFPGEDTTLRFNSFPGIPGAGGYV